MRWIFKIFRRIFAVSCDLILLAAIAVFPANASLVQWDIAPQSTIMFLFTQMGGEVEGKFTRFDGDIRFDLAQLSATDITIFIDASSAITGEAGRDSLLQGRDFFDIAHHEQISFRAKTVQKIAAQQYHMQGELTIKDISMNFEFPFLLKITGDQAQMMADFSLNRIRWNIGLGEWAGDDIVGHEVRIMMRLRATIR